MSEDITPEQAQALIDRHARQRMEQLQAELAQWLSERNCDLGATAQLVPDGSGRFVIVAVPQLMLKK